MKKPREYHIKFDVEAGGRAINSICVKLERQITKNIDKQFRVDLCDDPLYAALVAYVKSNPLPDGDPNDR